MNAVAKIRPRGGLPTLPDVPAPSEQLLAAIRNSKHLDTVAVDGPPFDGPQVGEAAWYFAIMPLAAAVDEAKAIARAMQPLLEPAGPSVLAAWLLPVAAAVRNPPTQADYMARVAAMALICANAPACVFSAKSQREALRRFSFWPSASDVYALLQEFYEPTLDRYRTVSKIARARPYAELAAARREHEERQAHLAPTWPAAETYTPMSGAL